MVFLQDHKQISANHNNNNFPLNYLMGSIGQAVIATYLREFRYEIYPFGYENNYANIFRYKKTDYSDDTSMKIRSMPDLLVYDRDNDIRFLLQIKTTKWKDPSCYWIKKTDFDCYQCFWPEALLIVYCIPTANIYCCKIRDIKNPPAKTLPDKSTPGYCLNLTIFPEFTTFFSLITPDKYREFSGEIESILRASSRISAL